MPMSDEHSVLSPCDPELFAKILRIIIVRNDEYRVRTHRIVSCAFVIAHI